MKDRDGAPEVVRLQIGIQQNQKQKTGQCQTLTKKDMYVEQP